MTAVDQAQEQAAAAGAFASELQVRLEEATTQLHAAEAMGDQLLAQIAEGDLADLRAMAARNDVPLP